MLFGHSVTFILYIVLKYVVLCVTALRFSDILGFAVTKDLNVEEDSVMHRMLQAVAVPVIGNVCHIFMHGLNSVQVFFFLIQILCTWCLCILIFIAINLGL